MYGLAGQVVLQTSLFFKVIVCIHTASVQPCPSTASRIGQRKQWAPLQSLAHMHALMRPRALQRRSITGQHTAANCDGIHSTKRVTHQQPFDSTAMRYKYNSCLSSIYLSYSRFSIKNMPFKVNQNPHAQPQAREWQRPQPGNASVNCGKCAHAQHNAQQGAQLTSGCVTTKLGDVKARHTSRPAQSQPVCCPPAIYASHWPGGRLRFFRCTLLFLRCLQQSGRQKPRPGTLFLCGLKGR